MAIARTLADIAPDHPVTRHLVVAYWKGGDEVVEPALYRPEHIEKIVALPPYVSAPPTYVNHELKDHLDTARLEDDWYRVYGGEQNEGAVIVSQLDEPVGYSALLSCRVANVVPVDGIEKVTAAVNAYTQTIGIYPESLKAEPRDILPLFAAQRLTSLGYA